MKKIVVIFLLILALPIILLLILASLAVFVPAPQCPAPKSVDIVSSLDKKSKELEKIGSVTITDDEATSGLQQSFGQNIKDLRVCFTKDHLNASGRASLGKLKPSFYLSTEINTDSGISAKDAKVTVGGLGFLSQALGGLAEQQINNQLKGAQMQANYKVQFEDGHAIISISKTSKKQP